MHSKERHVLPKAKHHKDCYVLPKAKHHKDCYVLPKAKHHKDCYVLPKAKQPMEISWHLAPTILAGLALPEDAMPSPRLPWPAKGGVKRHVRWPGVICPLLICKHSASSTTRGTARFY